MATLHLRLEPRDGEPFRHEVRADAVVIGRSSKADVVLADRFLSRLHARLFRKDDAWYLEDLGARNTTFLTDRPLGQPTVVRPGDVIRLVESRLIVEGPERPAPSGDGLVGGLDDRLPGSAVLRSATLFLSPEREAATQGEAVLLAGRLRVLNEVHRSLAAPITLEALLDLILDRAFAHLARRRGPSSFAVPTARSSARPIFSLGHWRSGTTHLHNLLGRDPNHTYTTVYQCVFPTSFLTGEKIVPKLTGRFLTETRTYDNVKHGWHEAAQDEIALVKLHGLSPYVSFMFPDNRAKYAKYIDFLECTEKERQIWKDGLSYLIKKVMIATGGKRVVIKSCTHAARIRLLLEMFPDAKFVHIHRNPYECFASTLHMRSHTDWENFFHLPEENWDGERMEQTAMLGARIFERLYEDKHLIPERNYYEVASEDLVATELAVLKEIYDKFDMPDQDQYLAAISDYLDSVKGYKTNVLSIDEELRDFVWDRWRVAFDTYGYQREYPAPRIHSTAEAPSSEDSTNAEDEA